MAATFALDGALDAAQGGNSTGAASTGIGVASNQSGVTVAGNFTDSALDILAHHIGGAANDTPGFTSASASNTGQVINPPVNVTAGSGYTNGTYLVQSNASGGQLAGAASILFTVAGGAITLAEVQRPGSGFTGAPTFTVANAINTQTGAGPGAGVGGALVVAVGLMSQAYMLGAAFGVNKNTRRTTATAPVAINAAVAPSTYLNRSGRAMLTGESTWAVEP
jgi:hypothetical protein